MAWPKFALYYVSASLPSTFYQRNEQCYLMWSKQDNNTIMVKESDECKNNSDKSYVKRYQESDVEVEVEVEVDVKVEENREMGGKFGA